MDTLLKGRTLKVGDNIDTDLIIPARYLVTTDPDELAKHCLEGYDPIFPAKVQPGDILVAGDNFGCGSSREHAPIAIKGAGIQCVVAGSFARIFYRNAFNMGLCIVESPEAVAAVKEGEEVEVDVENGSVKRVSDGTEFPASPVPPFMRELLAAGGLMPYLAQKKQADA